MAAAKKRIGYIHPKDSTSQRLAVYETASGTVIVGRERYADLDDLKAHTQWKFTRSNPRTGIYSWRKTKKRHKARKSTAGLVYQRGRIKAKKAAKRSKNPLPVGRMVTVKAYRRPDGKIDLYG